MPLLSLIILALIQGLTEFLPVSSSGHLVLFHALNGEAENIWAESLVLDVAVHMGTLLSVIVYFRNDLRDMLKAVFRTLSFRRRPESIKAISRKDPGLRRDDTVDNLVWYVLIASVPVVIAGFILFSVKPSFLRSIEIMAWMSIVFGVVLGMADRYNTSQKDVSDLGWRGAVFIGLFQMLALIPGVSRSGITMTAGRFLRLSPSAAAKFSLLLSIIAIAGAGVLAGKDLYQSHDVRLGFDAFIAILLSFAAGLASITIMMRWLERHGFMPFVIYRVILGAVLLGLIYGGIVPT